MSESQMDLEELRDAMRKCLENEVDLHAVRNADDQDRAASRSLWTTIAELGWLGLSVAENHGGMGLGLLELSVLYEELGRQLAPIPVAQTLLAVHALQAVGSEAQKSRWLPGIVSGEHAATIALACDTPALKIDAPGFDAPGFDAPGLDVVLAGTICNVVDADFAELILLPIEMAADGKSGFVMVQADDPGVTIRPRKTVDLTRRLCDVILSDIKITGENTLILDAQAYASLLDHAFLAIACDAIGGAARILEITVEYMKVREQFNRPIGSFQALKHRCAQWKIVLEAASALTNYAVGDRESPSASASNAKFYAAETYAKIAGDSIQLHGGIGFTWEYDCHLFFKRAKLNEFLYGDIAWHKERTASLVFREPLKKSS